jgi:site-specific recombinase XerD
MNSRFHVTDEKYQQYTENTLSKAVDEKRITDDDARLIRIFVDNIAVTSSSLSPVRVFKIVVVLVSTRAFLPGPFADATIEDLNTAVREIKASSEYAQNTKSDFVRFLKRFFLWLIDREHSHISKKRVREIKVPSLDAMTKTADMMLTEDEVKAIIGACKTSRDRAFLAMLYEGGFRIGELGNLKWNQVNFPVDREWAATINVDDKTGVPRLVPLVMSKPYLIQYMEDTSTARDPDSYVFTVLGRSLQYAGMAKVIKIATKNAKVAKKVTPHLFRHSRITHLLRDGMGETMTKAIMWGNQSTEQLKTYVHLSNESIMDAVAEKYGIVKPEKKTDQKKFGPQQCPVCLSVNTPTARFCDKCGRSLTGEAEATETDVLSMLRDLAQRDPQGLIDALQGLGRRVSLLFICL